MTQYLDSHAHLDATDFDADRESVIERARDAGLRYLLLIADVTRPESVERIRDLAERHDGTYWAAGIDPHQSAQARDVHFEALSAAAQHPKFLAVGEIGLDYFYDYPRDVQERVFVQQIELARELRRPIIIHCRDAWTDLQHILRDHCANARSGGKPSADEQASVPAGAGILHCFTGVTEDAMDLIDLGYYVSFAGNVTYKKAEALREAARSLPADRLLPETDSPYLAPLSHRGRRNEPAFVRETTRQLATLRGWDEEMMGRQLVQNFARLFGLPS